MVRPGPSPLSLLLLACSLMLHGFTILAAGAEEQLPPGVEDPFGLGPRLALIDHLKEEHGITMPAGSDWAIVLARYEALPGKKSVEEALAADRIARLKRELGLPADSDFTEDELRQRLAAQKEAESSAYGVSNPNATGSSRRSGSEVEGGSQVDQGQAFEGPSTPTLRQPTGKLLAVPPTDSNSENGMLDWQYRTDTYAVYVNETNKELAAAVAAHAHAFQKAALPIMRLDRQPRLRGALIEVRVYADRGQYLNSSSQPPAASGGLCQFAVDGNGRAVRILVSVYGRDMRTFVGTLQHELTHALHAAAFGRLTHSWYAEGLASFFENWDITKTEAANFKARPKILARLPYISYQASIDKVPDLQQFWETTWNSNSPYRYQIAEAFMDYLMLENEPMLKRCHAKCRAEAPAHRYFTDSQLKEMNKGFQEHIKRSMAAAKP